MAYWVVGAMFGGQDDQCEMFVRRGYWYCWDPKKPRDRDIPEEVQERFRKVQVGDRIAVKRLLGRGSSEIEIRALGIVTDIDLNEWWVYVNWLLTGIERRVQIHGCVGSIHGPYDYNDDWTRAVFCI